MMEKSKGDEMGNILRQVYDAVPIKLRGIISSDHETVSFFHRCCRCGLRHRIVIKRKLKDKSGVSITFTRLKDITKEDGK